MKTKRKNSIGKAEEAQKQRWRRKSDSGGAKATVEARQTRLWSSSALASPPHDHHRFIKEQGKEKKWCYIAASPVKCGASRWWGSGRAVGWWSCGGDASIMVGGDRRRMYFGGCIRRNETKDTMESLGIRMPQERVETVPEDVQQPTEANTDDIRTPHLDHEGDNQADQNQEYLASHDQAEHHAQEEQDHHTTQEEPVVSSSQPNDQVTTEDSLQPEQDHHTTQEEPVDNDAKNEDRL
ncbi:hypothetical protein DY000_02007718 [Brassica cretica]|uniref:Uncharacterized protein n=1 Tax=Brassica cretica TaxID=69181 RepID=A0ABQ7BXL3_BRACR|nr:hypothetical protein DY000_02007718 [Brassica cretica]